MPTQKLLYLNVVAYPLKKSSDGVPSPGRKEFIRRVMRQLPGLDEPRILVRFADHFATPEQDAETAAEYFQEPAAVASMNGRLLAYRVPERWNMRRP
jgi:hypothetical protein